MLEIVPMSETTTIEDFEKRFATEEACIEYLRSMRWPKGFSCPSCGAGKSWTLRERALEQCAACGHQVSITAGTIFHGTRKPLRTWFRVIQQFLVSKSGCSAKDIERQHGLRYETAWTWLHKIRSFMDRAGKNPLQGPVEADETYVGGEDIGGGGRSLEGKKSVVVGAVEVRGRACGRVRLAPSGSAAAADLLPFVVANVKKESTVFTDGWGGYARLPKDGYDHVPQVIGDPKRAPKVLPKIHRVFSLLHRLLLGTYQGAVSKKHEKVYLDEYTFRFNRRNSRSRWLLVQRFFECCFSSPPTYRELVDGLDAQPQAVGGA